MWFIFAFICLLSWGCADLFYKKGTDDDDKSSHLKIAVTVGLIMGLFSIGVLLFTGTKLNFIDVIKYTPASAMYILSMVIGYAGMRYLEISIISPVQNSSGALSAIFMTVYFLIVGRIGSITEEFGILDILGTVIICVGVIALAIVEKRLEKSPDGEAARGSKKYKMGAAALIFPLLYCLFDTLGTAADGIILDGEAGLGLSELQVMAAYGLTFMVFGLACWLYMLIFKKKVFNPFRERDKMIAAGCETFGQFFYIYAMAQKPVVAAPMISAYCIVSVILSRVFLKEKLTKKQYAVVFAVIFGIVMLGVSEGLAEA